MYKMIIADDEAIERFAFRTVVSKEFPEIQIVGEAASGREVIEMATETKPDIIVMDIKMPGANGIEAAKQIKATLDNVHIVILTAYDNFNYIQEGLKIGIDDYLLKPSRKEKIIQVLKNTINLIDEERKKREFDENMALKIEQIRPVIENQLVSSVVFGDAINAEVRSCLKFLDIDFSLGYIMILNIGEHQSSGPEGYVKSQIVYKEIYDFVYARLHDRYKCVISSPLYNSIVVIMSLQENMDEYRTRLLALNIADEICLTIKQNFGKEIFIGVGKAFRDISEISRSYKEAVEALKTTQSGEGVRHFGDISTGTHDAINYPIQKEKAFLEALKAGDRKKCCQLADEIFSWVFNNLGRNFSLIKTYVISLIGLILRTVIDDVKDGDSISQILKEDYYTDIESIRDVWNLKKWFEKILNEVLTFLCSVKQDRLSGVINTAIKYIKGNYMEDITLEKVAEVVLISPQYFSKIFKQETGVNFIEYLTNERIGRAKELLLSTNLNVKQISYKVGYNDPNYFFRVFKKSTGMTPGEYRTEHS